MRKSTSRRVILTVGIFFILVAIVTISWKLSSQTATQSNQLSMRIAERMIDGLDKYFDLDRGDVFWEVTFNQLIRKAAHYLEYVVIGGVMCVMLNIAVNRALPAAIISIVVSPLFGIIDEYHQRFSPMRSPLLLDVCIDTAGVLTGIAFVTVFFLIFNYIRKLKKKISELEQKKI